MLRSSLQLDEEDLADLFSLVSLSSYRLQKDRHLHLLPSRHRRRSLPRSSSNRSSSHARQLVGEEESRKGSRRRGSLPPFRHRRSSRNYGSRALRFVFTSSPLVHTYLEIRFDSNLLVASSLQTVSYVLSSPDDPPPHHTPASSPNPPTSPSTTPLPLFNTTSQKSLPLHHSSSHHHPHFRHGKKHPEKEVDPRVWWYCSDTLVQQVPVEEVLKAKAYLLFFQKTQTTI